MPRSPREGYKGYKDGLRPESLADGNWLVKQNQPVSKIENSPRALLSKVIHTQGIYKDYRN
jgi:hypothetical protein